MNNDPQALSLMFTLKGEMLAPVSAGAEAIDSACRFKNGLIIDRKYEITGFLGQGGMGAVYKAHHMLLNKEVALKTFRPDQLTEEALRRFQREAQAIARLSHPNIVQVFDFGIGEGNLPYYTMECLVGQSLAEKLSLCGYLSLAETVEIFVQACRALSFAHRKGVVHRDLKPGNIFLAKGLTVGQDIEVVKIVDFGIAGWALPTEEKQKLTIIGSIFGSPLYMSPEQSRGELMTARSDIYSAGCALFEALTGRPPFRGENAFATIIKHQSESVPKLLSPEGEPDFPLRLAALIEKMLAKDPANRCESFDEVESELQEVLKSATRLGRHASASTPARMAQKEEDDEVHAAEAAAQQHRFKTGAVIISSVFSVFLAIAVVILGHASPKHPIPNSMVPKAIVPKRLETTPQPQITPFLVGHNGRDGGRIFQFPADKPLGILKVLNSATGKVVVVHEARGTVSVPPGCSLRLVAQQSLSENPDLFDGFGPDDLAELQLESHPDYSWCDDHLKRISRLTGLVNIDITESRTSEVTVGYLNNLRKLRQLSVRYTNFTGQQVAKLSVLPKLTNLAISGIVPVSLPLEKLRDSRNIEILRLDSTDLRKSDFEVIATMRNLKDLCVFKNKGVTDEALKLVVDLPSLSTLKIDETAVTPQSLGTLRAMRALKVLNINDWPEKQKTALNYALPECKIHFNNIAASTPVDF